MGDLASQPGIKPWLPVWEVQRLSHWTTREVPPSSFITLCQAQRMTIPNSFVGARMEVSVKCHRSAEGISNLPGGGLEGV